MLIKSLRRVHAEFDLIGIERNRDLFAGGERMRKNITRYLSKNEQEPAAVYKRRCDMAADEYINYCGPIGNYFASWLFTSQLTYKTDPEGVDEFYDDFKEDCNGRGTEFDKFLHQRFIEAMQDRSVFWRVEYPETPPAGAEPTVLAEWTESGLGRATVVVVPSSSIINWKCDPDGYLWMIEYVQTCDLEEPDDEKETVVETWTEWRRDEQHRRFELRYPKGQKPPDTQEAPEIPMPWTQGQIRGIPMVELELPEELWIMNIISAPQLANFRKRAGLSWAIDRTCYAMPVFCLKNRRKPPTMGTGYYIMIGADETLTYASPPAAPFAVIKDFISELKDEIHRVASQMARGIDNDATAVGRSGDSKEADNLATEIVLAGYGKHIRASAKKTLNLISEGRGDNITHTVGGMQSYHVTDADSFSKMALATQGMSIPSPTHHRLVAKRQSVLMLPDVDEGDRQLINQEIDAGITDESVTLEANSRMGILPGMTSPEGETPPGEAKKTTPAKPAKE